MKLIETQMTELHKTIRYEHHHPHNTIPTNIINDTSNINLNLEQYSNMNTNIAIGIFDEVMPNSPAYYAGICNGDQLLKYGSIQLKEGMILNIDISNCMNEIAKYTSSHINQEIILIIKTSLANTIKEVVIIPKQWVGKGLLGCHLTPTIIQK